MAAATPVLERRNDTQSEYTDDMQHNARIRDNYARLIDPNTKLNELMGREEETDSNIPAAQPYNQSEYYRANPYEALFGKQVNSAAPAQAPVQQQASAAPVRAAAPMAAPAAPAQAPAQSKPFLVTNARADADIFRADSPINRNRYAQSVPVQQPAAPAAPVTSMVEEEENEDLKPTRTTIQYGSAEREDDEILPSSTVKSEPHITIGKRERIIIGAFISMVVALFVLVIINSAIISGLNSDINEAQSALDQAVAEYTQVNDAVAEAKSEASVYAFAAENNMIFDPSED